MMISDKENIKIKYFGHCPIEGFIENFSEYLGYEIERETEKKLIGNENTYYIIFNIDRYTNRQRISPQLIALSI
ncbi:hypothetical protein [Tenacibaculum agarivorans]|uniref:hypothetical protein n=1 Tax=Tenacibaculum agarivorans TaxID=1908389 RepID=UPI000AD5CF78|nr:hypothetical protein [Tenacibaculum agarivorans]